MKLLKKGAEADIYRAKTSIIKMRPPKKYRITELDEKLRKTRTRKEAKLLFCAGQLINAPQVLRQDEFSLELEFIDGVRVKDVIDIKNYQRICRQITQSIAKLHNAEIIHGDLTTSNMILSKGRVYLFDFGLGFFSKSIEDMAVDLNVLFNAFHSTHSEIADKAIALVIFEYEKTGGKKEVLKRIEKLKSRGRYLKKPASSF